MTSGKVHQIAVIGLEAIEKVDRARQRSRNVKGPVLHDLRVGAKIAKQACLALCQHASRFGAEQATTEALSDAQSRVLTLERENERLRIEFRKMLAGSISWHNSEVGRTLETRHRLGALPPVGEV